MKEHLFLTGPTASGKTAVGIALARRINAEIVSLDSMAVYRGMMIGTAMPTPGERAAVPHHLIDFRDPRLEYTLSDYIEDARAAVAGITARGKKTIFVGGTALYLKSLLRGIFKGPPADPAFRKEMDERTDRHGVDWLWKEVERVDPQTAAKRHPNDRRRLIRALEVYRASGIPISRLQRQFDRPVPREQCRVYVLDQPREVLYRRIDVRVERMFQEGLRAEARTLWNYLNSYPKATARQAVGYRELFDYFDRGENIDRLPEVIAAIKTHTRQFAKRQGTWFRSLEECRFVPVDEPMGPEELADRLTGER